MGAVLPLNPRCKWLLFVPELMPGLHARWPMPPGFYFSANPKDSLQLGKGELLSLSHLHPGLSTIIVSHMKCSVYAVSNAEAVTLEPDRFLHSSLSSVVICSVKSVHETHS
jgi:hypothetical protein